MDETTGGIDRMEEARDRQQKLLVDICRELPEETVVIGGVAIDLQLAATFPLEAVRGNEVATSMGMIRTILPEGLVMMLNINCAAGIPERPQDINSKALLARKFFPDTDVTRPNFLPRVTRVGGNI